jgi:hypothetical protein
MYTSISTPFDNAKPSSHDDMSLMNISSASSRHMTERLSDGVKANIELVAIESLLQLRMRIPNSDTSAINLGYNTNTMSNNTSVNQNKPVFNMSFQQP